MTALLSPLLPLLLALLPLLTLPSPLPLNPPPSSPSATRIEAALPAAVQLDVFAANLGFVTAFVFAADGRLYFADSNRKAIGVLDHDGNLVERIRIPGLSGRDSQVLGLALDPNFSQNGRLYVHYLESDGWVNRVVRFRHQDGQTGNPLLLLDLPLPRDPANPDQPCTDHNGGHIAIGPDGSLYVPMGDNCRQDLAQDLTVPQGKVLRLDRATGAGLPGNPFFGQDSPNDDRIWAWGVRNPYGSAIDPVTGDLWLTDNGPGCGDEVNRIEAGGNYGWPLSSPSYTECVDLGPGYRPPAWWWDITIAPTGFTFYDSLAVPGWQNSLLTCDWNTNSLRILRLDAARTTVVSESIIDLTPVGCQLDIETGPDGYIYFNDMTSIYRLSAHNICLPLVAGR
ncbi:MAG: PQQ-dependent sugar dehydrogenase [Caldilineales bacterium]|nr:PQQ-dependent sugar dehydrogenase [Caldilineales bacterium]